MSPIRPDNADQNLSASSTVAYFAIAVIATAPTTAMTATATTVECHDTFVFAGELLDMKPPRGRRSDVYARLPLRAKLRYQLGDHRRMSGQVGTRTGNTCAALSTPPRRA